MANAAALGPASSPPSPPPPAPPPPPSPPPAAAAAVAACSGSPPAAELPRECRICRDPDDGAGLVSPCACSGSMRWVHEKCLATWLKARLRRQRSGGGAVGGGAGGGGGGPVVCEVCGSAVTLALHGSDLLLFPYSVETHDDGDPLLISVLVLAVAASTALFLTCTALESAGVDLWTPAIRWIISPVVLLLKIHCLVLWGQGHWCRGGAAAPLSTSVSASAAAAAAAADRKKKKKGDGPRTPAYTMTLMRVFRVVPSISYVLFTSFLNTTRVCYTTVFENEHESIGPPAYRLLVFVSALLNYVSMAFLLHRAYGKADTSVMHSQRRQPSAPNDGSCASAAHTLRQRQTPAPVE
eukprot:Rhum_TRINITY_DN14497_c37_g1::Rhum_TRINITY_DN14497_c37_g1_i1::g.93289::m.93289